jgi:hypothetical protein
MWVDCQACWFQRDVSGVCELSVPAAIDYHDGMLHLQIHYDNTGGDVGEAVEVVFPTALTGNLTLPLYNGADGTVYSTLTIILPAGRAIGTTGFSVASVNGPAAGIQNGAPDGIALICNGAFVQFLSYEGSFVAVGGPAVGRTSTDVGVSELGKRVVKELYSCRRLGHAAASMSCDHCGAFCSGNANSAEMSGV